MLRKYLQDRNVLCLQRLSIRHIAAVQNLSGALVHGGDLNAQVAAHALGVIGSTKVFSNFSFKKKYLCIYNISSISFLYKCCFTGCRKRNVLKNQNKKLKITF